MVGFLQWLQHNSVVTTISETGWMYAIAEVTHYFSLFVLVGTVVLVDLRVLGVAARRQTVTQVAEQMFPWTWGALVFALLSGFVMFATDATDFFPDIVFRTKMTVMILALIFAVIVQRSVPKWAQAPVMSSSAKAVALVSLLLWLGTILAGVEIAAYSGLG